MTELPKIFTLAKKDSESEILEALAAWPNLHEDPPSAHRRIYFDSFDWRLHKAGLRLCLRLAERQEGLLELLSDSGEALCRWPGRKKPAFARDLPECRLRDELEPVLEMRRLFPQVEVAMRCTPYKLLDSEEKTVARLHLQRSSSEATPEHEAVDLPLRIHLLPIRGYGKAFSRIAERLESLPLTSGGDNVQTVALRAQGRREASYSGKIETILEPEQKAGDAVIQIFRDLLATIRINEPGTRQDLDSEFLHDFRVAIRRTRSGLGQFKALMATEKHAHFRSEFRWLGGATGPTRDLDVYLLKFPVYQESLPEHVRENLLPLRDFLVRHQRQEQRKLARVLRSARYRKLLADWQAFLDGGLDRDNPQVCLPITEIAGRRLRKAARRVLQDGERAVRDRSPAEDLHALRIDGKKLRYLMEFFRTLYPAKRIKALIGSLKVLQDNLGDFNDYEVQQGALLDFAKQMAAENEPPVQTLMAMGRLVALLEVGQEEERIRFQACFESFSTPENRRLMKRLFRSETGKA